MKYETKEPGEKSSLFHLPYHHGDSFWIAVEMGPQEAPWRDALLALGMAPSEDSLLLVTSCGRDWNASWRAIDAVLQEHQATPNAAVLPSEKIPETDEWRSALQPCADIARIAGGFWLGEAMLADRIFCHMQPVLDRRGRIFGYEAFARVESEEGEIGGGAIFTAGKALGIGFMLDRYLHVKAVSSFVERQLDGFLFINFIPGFIHRPDKYLEGLQLAAQQHDLPLRRIVLDCTHSEAQADFAQLKTIHDFCRAKGYLLSVDDISTPTVAQKIFSQLRPDIVKLDMKLTRDVEKPEHQRQIRSLVSVTQEAGAMALAEGVETETQHRYLMEMNLDLFQGFLLQAPEGPSR
jgi:EAL domain-containing protein (putative c-di-GMP-specific phosphodiesterase class I)